MGRYVFYQKELFPMDNKPEQVYGIIRDTISYWKHEYPNESEYVVKHTTFLETKVERLAHNHSIITRVVGTMAEEDYVFYILKYC